MLALPLPFLIAGRAVGGAISGLWDIVVTIWSRPAVLIVVGLAFAAGWWQGTSTGARRLGAYIAAQERDLAAKNGRIAALDAELDALRAANDARRAAAAARALKDVPSVPACTATCGLSAEARAHLNSIR